MKNLLGIVILGLLLSGNAYAEKNVKRPVKLPKDIVKGYNTWSSTCTFAGRGKCMVPDYAFQVVNKSDGHPVRLGKKSIRFELRSGDCHQKKPTSYNDCKANPPAERHELEQEYDKVALSGETWHTYSLFIPKDTPLINSEWITMGQFHNLDYHKPPVNLDLVGKHFEIVTRFLCIHPKRFNKKCYSDEPENVRKIIIRKDQLFGKWNDFTFHSKWSTKVDKGFFKAWVNGKLVYHFEGRTKVPKDGSMFKFGIYRGAAPKVTKDSTHVVYYDEIRYAKKSCKKLKLKDLGYTCKELENQKLEKIHTIK